MEKKKMKLWKKILILIVVVIILFIGNLIRKSLIIQNIKNKLAQSQLETNFYISSITYQLDDDSVNVLKYYRNGENVFQKIEFSSLQSVKTYKKEGKISKYMDTPEDNICILNLSSETLPTTTVSNAFIEQLNELNKLEYIKLLINAKIKSENNYYKIKVNFLDMNPTIIMEENKTEKDYKNVKIYSILGFLYFIYSQNNFLRFRPTDYIAKSASYAYKNPCPLYKLWCNIKREKNRYRTINSWFIVSTTVCANHIPLLPQLFG